VTGRGQDLVAPDIEGAHRDGPPPRGGEGLPVERLLLGRRGHALRHHELKLGAEQTDPLRPRLVQVGEVDQQAGIEVQADLHPVAGDRRNVAEGPVLLLPPRPQADHLGVGRFDLRPRPDMDLARDAVDDDRIAGLAERCGVLDLAHGGDAQRPGDDGHVTRRPPLLQHDAPEGPRVVVEERRRPHGARHEDRVLGKGRVPCRAGADQRPQQAVGEVVEVVQALAEIGVGLPQHPRPVVRLHPLHGGFRGEARGDGLAHPAQPALVVGEHPHRFQHLPGFGGADAVPPLDQGIDGRAHAPDRRIQPLDLAVDVLGDEGLHHEARLVQHHVAEPDPVREGQPPGHECLAGDARLRAEAVELPGGDHLREHHRGGLERLDLLLGIDPVGLVLDREHAEGMAGAQEGDAEEGVIDFLARLRAVREGRVLLRVRQGQGLGRRGDQADEALVGAQPGEMHRLAVQALGGEEFEDVVVAQHIDRADLRHDVGGDQDDDPVETRLRTHRLRHGFAEAAQQKARASERSGHRIVVPASAGGRGVGPLQPWRQPPRDGNPCRSV